MSRSRKKHPVCGMTNARSDKPGKIIGHRRTRRAASQALHHGEEIPDHRATENPWGYPKDGKQWVRRPSRIARALRK